MDWNSFRDERFINKTKPLTATVKKNNLPNFKTMISIDKPNAPSEKESKASLIETQRTIALAKARKYPLETLFKYELMYKNQLFDNDGLFTKEDGKSSLITHLEQHSEYNSQQPMNKDGETCLVIDVMLVLRKLSFSPMKTFKELADKFCSYVSKKAAVQNTKRIDMVFDSYFEKSLKSTEHQRRCTSDSIPFHVINDKIKFPKQADTFWGLSKNKILLQHFLRDYIMENSIFYEFELIFSTINESFSVSNDPDFNEPELQRTEIEEADVKIIVHVNHAITKKFRHVYVISSDTDVIVLLFYFVKTFAEKGLEVIIYVLLIIFLSIIVYREK